MVDEILIELEKEEYALNNCFYFDGEDNHPICSFCGWKSKRPICGGGNQGISLHLSKKHDFSFRPERENDNRIRIGQHERTRLHTIKRFMEILNKYPRGDNFSVGGKLRSADAVIRDEIMEEFDLEKYDNSEVSEQ